MLPSTSTVDVPAFYASFKRDVAVFEQKLPEMLRQFPEQFVAIFDGKIIDHSPEWKDLIESIEKRFPGQYVFVEQVVPKKEIAVDMDTIDG